MPRPTTSFTTDIYRGHALKRGRHRELVRDFLEQTYQELEQSKQCSLALCTQDQIVTLSTGTDAEGAVWRFEIWGTEPDMWRRPDTPGEEPATYSMRMRLFQLVFQYCSREDVRELIQAYVCLPRSIGRAFVDELTHRTALNSRVQLVASQSTAEIVDQLDEQIPFISATATLKRTRH
ncbi:MAG: hypothetical protein KDD44_00795 [Bdellovibrionales bacterium]|nr:hypothetical protein [Bdellovibrionales bacterium]